MKRIFLLLFIISASCLNAQETVKFLLFADLHYDIMPDAEGRLRTVIEQAKKQKVDFMLELGDFIPITPQYAAAKERVQASPVKLYHTLGNHDVDSNDKQAYINYWGIPASYYYFDKGKFRFIVLDSDFFRDKDGVIKPYNKGNYGRVEETERNKYSKEELAWLENLLQDTEHICILFSHAPINDQYAEISENKDIHAVITKARDNGTKIAMVFGGHMHSDNYHQIDGINYMQVNSISNIWGGSKFINTERYSESDQKKYPSVKYVIPYEKALYAIVEVNASGTVKIKGVKSKYIKPEPDKELLKTKPYPCSSIISSLKLTF